MKVTFPHMGNTYIGAKVVAEELGKEVIPPPKISKKTLEIGTKHSPESICLPLKINIGNYIESISNGADTILITGSCGPCRFGFYPTIEKEILKDLEYDVNLVTFEPPDGKPLELVKSIMDVAETKNIYRIVRSVFRAGKVLNEVDKLTSLSNKKRAWAVNSYEVDIIMDGFLNNINKVYGASETMKLIKDTIRKIEGIEIDNNKNPIKVGIVGEIYTIIEPFANLYIERKLGHLGVEVSKSLTPSDWVKHHLLPGPLGSKHEKEKWEAAKPYLSTLVGGHGQETVGSTVIYAEEGYDGVIQILPLTCMPEIVAQSIIPTIQEDYKMPIMTLIVDEMTGEAGYLTRIEAFVDLLKKRREEGNYEGLLFGN